MFNHSKKYPEEKIRPEKIYINLCLYFTYRDITNLGRIRSEVKQPNANGNKNKKLKFAVAWITGLQAPKITNMALPEIPGIKKNEKAITPLINKYNGVTAPELIFNSCKKNPIKIPKNKKKSKLNLFNEALKKFAT